jgi:hypothetical protein
VAGQHCHCCQGETSHHCHPWHGLITGGARRRANKRLAIPIKEFTTLSPAAGHFVDLGNHIFWHQQLCPSISCEELACVKVKEVVAPLVITSWTKGNGTKSAGGHGVIMVLMDLAYAPNSMQQCLLKWMPCPVTILRGLRVGGTLSDGGRH